MIWSHGAGLAARLGGARLSGVLAGCLAVAVLGLALRGGHIQAACTDCHRDTRYREIFAHSRGRYGTTLEYARMTCEHLRAIGIHDAELERVVALADNTPTPHTP